MEKPELQQAESHPEHGSRDGTYVAVFGALALLTLTELIVTYVQVVKIPILVGLAATKATLVVAFYMHLRWEKRILPIIFAFPVVIAVLIALALQQLLRL